MNKKIKKFLLEALAGFIFWTGCLTLYMIFVVKVNFTQYLGWISMQALLVPPLAPFSVRFINWFVKRVMK